MKHFFFAFFILFCLDGFCKSEIIFDVVEKKIELKNFSLPDLDIEGLIAFSGTKTADTFILNLEAKDLYIEDNHLSWLKLRILKKDNLIIVDSFSTPQFTLNGKIDLISGDIFFDIVASYNSTTSPVFGQVFAKAKLWGKFDNFIISGSIDITDGRYNDIEFERLFFSFLGNPTNLVLNDSFIVLLDKSVYKVEGKIDVFDLDKTFRNLEFVLKNFSLGEWRLVSSSDLRLVKNVDDNFSVSFKDPIGFLQSSESSYTSQEDKYLQIRMQQNKSIFGFELRREF